MKAHVLLIPILMFAVSCKLVEPTDSSVPATTVADFAVANPDVEPKKPERMPVTIVASAQVAPANFVDGVSLDTLRLVDPKTLQLQVNFGGGCEAHDFEMRAQKPRQISAKNEVDVYFYHNAHNDMCEAWLSRTVEFDLSPLIAEYQGEMTHGEIKLMVHLPGEDLNGSHALIVEF
jgi:hypothetical protein